MPQPSKRAALVRLAAYAKPHRRAWQTALVCSVLNKIFDLAPPLLIGAAVDIVVRREGSILAQAGLEAPSHQLVALGVITLLVWGLESVFQYMQGWIWRTLAQTVEHDLRLDAYAHTQRLGLGWFEDRSTGGLLSVLNDDVNQLERFLDGGANDLIQVGSTVVVIGSIFFWIAPSVAWMAVLPMPFVLWGSFLYQRKLAARYRDVREHAARIGGLLSNNLAGIATIKSFTAEEREVERVRDTSEGFRQANRRAIKLSAAFSPLIRMVIVTGFTAMLVFGGLLTLDGGLEVGAYSVLVFMTQRLLWPLTRLGAMFDLYQRGMASAERVLDLLDVPPGIDDGGQPLPRDGVRGEVRFDEVRFAYGDAPPVIEGLNLDVPAGSTLGVVGATGAGKTTLIKLLLRFHDVDGGRITLDGHDLRELRTRALRDAIGLVSQDVFLFDGTVRENIAYARPDATDDEILRAARAAEALAFIEAMPRGLDTVVGERGQKLSGGQRQRLSIARALLKDPPVLVFDEATSSVDNETEAAIQRSLARIAHERTTVIIAHRLSTVRHADRIVVMERGRIAEQGTHDELVAARGAYASLWAVQTGEVREAAR
jgi:ATP-binding cassette subfamily B protein